MSVFNISTLYHLYHWSSQLINVHDFVTHPRHEIVRIRQSLEMLKMTTTNRHCKLINALSDDKCIYHKMRSIPRPAEKLYRSRQALVLPRSFSAIETRKCYRDSSVLLRIFGATEELYRYRELVFVVKGILVIKWVNNYHNSECGNTLIQATRWMIRGVCLRSIT